MERKKYLIVTAGGSGSRMGGDTPKQFLEIGGVPILRMTLERFMEAVPDLHILTVLPEAYLAYWRQYCVRENFLCPQRLVKGGFTRFHSVKNALAYVPDGAVVGIQDGVRPLLGIGKIRELYDRAQTVPALVPVIPVTDSVKVLEKGADGLLRTTGEIADRSRLFAAQTPQLFHSERIKEAYRQGFQTAFTDDASVAEACEIPLTFAEGERSNIKITTPEDLRLARAILSLGPNVP